ncbi:unnamed protein product [Brassica rapa]|uniref:Uncharacterized protein n=1 Tax=Brassica campestris TaxID=3711 RepID=A0A3P5YHP9_BRACM|nr:unnamed protein product [Brassica rapa]VDC63184.1 unnamed protein product [Brassica rapa]
MKNTTEKTKKMVCDDHDNDRILWDCGSPLYDSYELVSLTHIIERHFMYLPSLSGARKISSSRSPSDLGDKANRAVSTVVDLCCSSDSTTGKLLGGVFGMKWWKSKKNADVVEEEHNKKKTKKVFHRVLSRLRIPTTRSGSLKM